tara:strand:- start:1321 stop:1530 length:210 start_codon:yes stop_codon:yes gene_type:complete
MNKGILLRIATSDRGFYLTILSLFHFGITTTTTPTLSTMLLIGFWKFEVGFMLAERLDPFIDADNYGVS